MAAQKPVKKDTQYHCRDCEHATDWHSKALDGHMILCKCKYYTDGKWSQFLSAPQCEHFSLKR